MEFDWDEFKAEANLIKHGVSFAEALSVFADPLTATVFDPDHSKDEDRYISIGTSNNHRLLLVCHTDRGNVVRIISARVVTRSERRKYEDGTLH